MTEPAPPRPGPWRLGAAHALTLLGLRGALVGGGLLGLWAADKYYDPGTARLALDAATAVGGAGAAALGAFLAARWGGAEVPRAVRSRAWWVCGAVLAVLGAAKLGWHLTHEYALEATAPRALGQWPYTAGRTLEITRAGVTGTAHIGPTGLRRCAPEHAPPPPDDATRVALIGDSFVFGLVVEDAETLCWQLRELAEARAPGRFTFLNLGQPGANALSYARTLRYAAQTFGADRAFVGLLPPDDGILFDLDTTEATFDHPVGMVLGTLLDPYGVWALQQVFSRTLRAEGFQPAVLHAGMRAVARAADDTGVPTQVYIYDNPSRSHLRERWFAPEVALLEALADRIDPLASLGVLTLPGEGPAWTIPGDGHPTGRGHRVYAEALLDALLAAEGPDEAEPTGASPTPDPSGPTDGGPP